MQTTSEPNQKANGRLKAEQYTPTILLEGLERWRQRRIAELDIFRAEQRWDFEEASEGLKIASKYPEVLDEGFISELWEKLESSAVNLERLGKERERLASMELAELIIAFQKRAEPVYSWIYRFK